MSYSDGVDDRLDGTAAAFGTAAGARSCTTSAPARWSAYIFQQSSWLCLVIAVTATGCCGWIFPQSPQVQQTWESSSGPPLDGRFFGYSTPDVENCLGPTGMLAGCSTFALNY
ncbi:hypothetical protein OEZ85_004975 [Tetradesmus obliquus]|uniref:Uncharacterized protein n=1 Tax=Tetradesmus obliquus TaxID=3088 RepID=A0ABY8UIV9_TETOB|nr:hypothetical protein OEZ85_004975 [Tetradesmus obliquus]